jgi:urea-proton symporter
MDKSSLIVTPGLTPFLGYSLMIGIGVIFLVLANLIKNALVRNTHDFIIANRRIGLGFGVGTVISVWTWAMAVIRC